MIYRDERLFILKIYMKNIFNLALMILFSSSLHSMPILEFATSTSSYPQDVETINLEILDVDFEKSLAVFRHQYALPQISSEVETTGPYNCQYPDLRDGASGIIWGVYDFKNTRVKDFWTIYRSAYQKKDCTSKEQALANMNTAKKKIERLGLRVQDEAWHARRVIKIGYPPHFSRGLRPDRDQKNSLGFDLGKAGEWQYSLNSQRLNFGYGENLDSPAGQEIAKLVRDKDQAAFSVGELLLTKIESSDRKTDSDSGKVIWRVAHEDIFSMGSGGKFYLLNGFRKKDKVIFLIRFFHFNHLGGMTDKDIFILSPIFDLPSEK